MIRNVRKSASTKARCNWSVKRAARCPCVLVKQRVTIMNTSAKAQPTCFCSSNHCWGGARVNVTARRTKQDFARQMRLLVDVYFPNVNLIRVVVDNLNTHTPAALDETFAPVEARRITRKLEFHYTPQHGSWLNMAESEFAVLAAQCLDRRIPDVETLKRETAAWQTKRNQYKTKINWQFGTDLARIKLKRLYPSLE